MCFVCLQNDELKDMIKKMLDSANLEEVTMKTVLKDVSWDGVLVFNPIIKTYAYKKSSGCWMGWVC